MKRTLSVIFVLLISLSLLVSACQPAPAEPETAVEVPEEVVVEEAEEVVEEVSEEPEVVEITAVIGYTTSITGKYNVSSTRQVNGLNLWMEDVNEAGGIELSDGSFVKFEGITYDDESNTDRVQELYTRLATEDEADFLISPYSSGLTAASSVIAEQYGKVLITTGAADDANYKQGLTLAFQAYTPSSRYLTGAVDLLASLDESVTKLAFVYENSKFSTGVVEAAKVYAESEGYEIVLFEGYDPETADFGPFINKIIDAQPEAILGGGHFQDGSTFARQMHEKGVEINFLTLLVAPPEPDFADLGEAALGVVGPSQWEPLAEFTPESATEAGLDWLGLTGADFTADYMAAYDEEPSYHSAGGYAAGLILQKAIMEAGSVETAAVAAALDEINMLTFYGQVQFETNPDSHGLQVGHSMIYIQWQKDADGNLIKQVVWPPAGATADTIYPLQ